MLSACNVHNFKVVLLCCDWPTLVSRACGGLGSALGFKPWSCAL